VSIGPRRKQKRKGPGSVLAHLPARNWRHICGLGHSLLWWSPCGGSTDGTQGGARTAGAHLAAVEAGGDTRTARGEMARPPAIMAAGLGPGVRLWPGHMARPRLLFETRRSGEDPLTPALEWGGGSCLGDPKMKPGPVPGAPFGNQQQRGTNTGSMLKWICYGDPSALWNQVEGSILSHSRLQLMRKPRRVCEEMLGIPFGDRRGGRFRVFTGTRANANEWKGWMWTSAPSQRPNS